MGHRPPVSGDRGKSKVVSPFVSPAAARVEDEEAVAPEEGHGHSAGEAEFLGHWRTAGPGEQRMDHFFRDDVSPAIATAMNCQQQKALTAALRHKPSG